MHPVDKCPQEVHHPAVGTLGPSLVAEHWQQDHIFREWVLGAKISRVQARSSTKSVGQVS